MLLTDQNGVCREANPAACHLLGHTPNELSGVRLETFVVGVDADLLLAAVAEVARLGAFRAEWEIRRKNGAGARYDFLGLPFVAGEVLWTVRDAALDKTVRDEVRQRAEEAVWAERRFNEAMIDSMPGVLYLYDREGQFLRWNRNFEVTSGYSAEEVARMSPLDFFPAADRPSVERAIAEVFARGESSIEAPLLSKDGSTTPYFFTGRLVEFAGKTCLVGVGIDVLARRVAEDRLAERERLYRELVEYANSIILRWGVDGRITFLNEFGQRFFGYSAEEILGREVVGTIVPATESGGRNLELLMEQICAAPEWFGQNLNENMRRNGERVWIAWTNRIVQDEEGHIVEVFSVGTDVTERRRAEERIRESEAHLIEAQRIARIGSWELDPVTNRVWLSDQFYAILELEPADFGGTNEALLEFVHPEQRAQFVAAQQAALEGQARLDLEQRLVLRDGTEKVVQALADRKRDRAGRSVVLEGTVHDITDRVRVAAEREQRLRAEAADRIKSAFLATMSHELRTPLNSIIGFTGIILQGMAGPLNAEQKKQLEMVRSSARHLLALVNDVLDISKIEAGQLEVAAIAFLLPPAITKAAEVVRPQAQAKGLTLRVVIDPELTVAVGDERRFGQIVLNLLSNAVKFTEQGGVELEAKRLPDWRPAGASTAPAENTQSAAVRLRVIDTGIGIKAEDVGTLFQPFRQLDSGLARRHEGTGLGLAICRRLAELLGGEIGVESSWGKGSTFTVTLPLRRLGEP